jgi:hypothetical protein
VDRGAYFARRIHDALTGPNKDDYALLRLFLNLRHDDHFKVCPRRMRACVSYARHLTGRCARTHQAILGEYVDPLGLAIDLTEQIEDELAMPSISEIKRKYTWLFNETLEQALTKGTAGPFGALLLAMSMSSARPRRLHACC